MTKEAKVRIILQAAPTSRMANSYNPGPFTESTIYTLEAGNAIGVLLYDGGEFQYVSYKPAKSGGRAIPESYRAAALFDSIELGGEDRA